MKQKPKKELPEGWKWQYRNFEGEDEWEAICPHGIGHAYRVHGCDGCCEKIINLLRK